MNESLPASRARERRLSDLQVTQKQTSVGDSLYETSAVSAMEDAKPKVKLEIEAELPPSVMSMREKSLEVESSSQSSPRVLN